MHKRRFVVFATAASLLTLAAPAPATAVSYVDVAASDVTVKYNDCKTSSIQASGDWDTDVYNEVQIVVRNPRGAWFDEKIVYDDLDGYVQMNVRLCDEDRAGVYHVEVTAIGYDEWYEPISQAEGEASFRYTYIPKRKSRIRHKVIYRPAQPRWKYDVPGQLIRKGRGLKGARVLLIAKIAGDWYRIDGMRTRRRGYFGWRFKPNGLRWRYYFRGNRSTKPSVTDVFRTPRRTSGRPLARSRTATVGEVKALVEKAHGDQVDR